MSHAMMSIGDSVYITDFENKIIFVNKAFTDTYGYSEEEILNRPADILCGDASCNRDNGFLDYNEAIYHGEMLQCRKDESKFPALISHSTVEDEDKRFIADVWVVRDITEIKEAQNKLQIYATTDMLTGVLNRRAGHLILEKQLQFCKRNNLKLTLCYIDLDGLKDVNDKYGHQEGDECILIITDVLKETIRESDSLCRLGGDEFLLVLSECDTQDAIIIWDRIQQKIDEFNQKDIKPYIVSLSGGFSEYQPDSPKSVEELIALADAEMYKNKKINKAKREKVSC